MAFIYAYASYETTATITPGLIFINTSDDLATVMGAAYLNGQTLNPLGNLGASPQFTTGQEAMVNTTDLGTVRLSVYIDGSNNISLIPLPSLIVNQISTSPPASSASSLSLGSSYHNTFGYDVMITVYLSITSAVTASILLGVGPTNTPTQQTLLSGLSLAVLGIVPINIYLPAGYYAKLSTSGTITASISGQICMPV